MASLLGIGGISDKVQEVIKRVRQPIEKAINWVIEQAMKFAKKIGNKLGFGKDKKNNKDGKPDERTKEEKQADLNKALAEADKLLKDNKISSDEVKKRLPSIKSKYKMTSLELVVNHEDNTKEKVHVEGSINPSDRTPESEKDKWPPKPIVIKSKVGSPQKRKGYERKLKSGSQVGLTGWERAHSQGPGTGFESPKGILYAPRQVNQILQNKGIENFIRNLYKDKPSDVNLNLTTHTTEHEGTQRLASIVYTLDAERNGKKTTVFEVWIEVEDREENPRITYGAEDYGSLLRSFLSNALPWG
jgi:hypothetical protein